MTSHLWFRETLLSLCLVWTYNKIVASQTPRSVFFSCLLRSAGNTVVVLLQPVALDGSNLNGEVLVKCKPCRQCTGGVKLHNTLGCEDTGCRLYC